MKYCVFDLDGTLLNTLDDIANALNRALSAFSLPTKTVAEVRKLVGNGLTNLCLQALPEHIDSKQAEEIQRYFRELYFANLMVETAPYPGIEDLLETLRLSNIPMAVFSNKTDAAVKDLVQHYFPDTFQEAQGELPQYPRKPFPEGLWAMLDRMGATPQDTLYIGDSEVDYQTAMNAGLTPILCSWGFRSRAFLEAAGATKIIDTPQEVLNDIFNA